METDSAKLMMAARLLRSDWRRILEEKVWVCRFRATVYDKLSCLCGVVMY